MQQVIAVRDLNLDKFTVEFDCGHQPLFDGTANKRLCVYPGLNWSCPTCAALDALEIGDEVELGLSFERGAVTIAKFMGLTVEGKLRFILPDGQDDWFVRKEIVRVRRLR